MQNDYVEPLATIHRDRQRRIAVFVIATMLLAGGMTLSMVAQTKRSPMLACSPTSFADGGSLILHFSLPHPAELSIEAPDGTVFFMVYERNATTPAGQSPLVEKSAFRKMADLKLDVSTTMGSPLVYGRTSNERVFRAAGSYKIVLAENIQSDSDQNVYTCRVTLKPHR